MPVLKRLRESDLLPAYISLGGLTALVSVAFIRTLRGAPPDFVIVVPETTVFDLLAAMQRSRASVPVVARWRRDAATGAGRAWDVLGVVSKGDVAEALAEGMELFED